MKQSSPELISEQALRNGRNRRHVSNITDSFLLYRQAQSPSFTSLPFSWTKAHDDVLRRHDDDVHADEGGLISLVHRRAMTRVGLVPARLLLADGLGVGHDEIEDGL